MTNNVQSASPFDLAENKKSDSPTTENLETENSRIESDRHHICNALKVNQDEAGLSMSLRAKSNSVLTKTPTNLSKLMGGTNKTAERTHSKSMIGSPVKHISSNSYASGQSKHTGAQSKLTLRDLTPRHNRSNSNMSSDVKFRKDKNSPDIANDFMEGDIEENT